MAEDPDRWAKEGALRMARAIEIDRRRQEIDAVKLVQPLDLVPPATWFDPDSGRREVAPGTPLLHVGRYFRRSRAYAGFSQAQLAGKAGVTQSMVSRVERARAPGMSFDRFVDMCLALGRLFPFGVCPHDHSCGWQPIQPPAPRGDVDAFLDYLRRRGGES
ncbi:MAG TPA: helix-turn-helix transcriptional regulator [Candidatus Limnocylindria bacterium]|nr:helix-turn-helix transcriptional regulator [Candidatus Limnocylindria bacterium]